MLPTVADVLELDVVRRGSPRVLTAAERLDAPVRWVHVIELAEARHLLRGGELVLTTGIALPPDAAGLTRYVAGLAAAGVSAVAVELGSRYVRELPAALVAAAAVHRLPLIMLQRETEFIAVTEAVHAQILDARVAELRAAERLHQVFTDLAVAGASVDEVVAQASALAGVPVILADLAHRVLACSPAGRELEPLLAGFAGRSRAVTVPGRCGYDKAAGWLVSRVGQTASTRPGTVDWGRLIFVFPAAPGPADFVLAERTATALALARLVRAGQGTGELQSLGAAESTAAESLAAESTVLADLAGPGYANPADLEARITALGVPLAGHQLQTLVIAPAGPRTRTSPGAWTGPSAGTRPKAGTGPEPGTGAEPGTGPKAGTGRDGRAIAEALAAACRRFAVPAIVGPLKTGPGDDRAGGLLVLPAEADPDRLLASVASSLRKTFDGDLVVGAGPVVPSIAQARAALHEAGVAASVLAASGLAAGGLTPGSAASELMTGRSAGGGLTTGGSAGGGLTTGGSAGGGLTTGGSAAGGLGRDGSAEAPFARLADLRLAGLIYQLREHPALLAFADRELGPLLRHDAAADTDLVRVLTCYLRCGGNKAEAAHLAGLARPTLYERLRKIEQVLGRKLDTPESSLSLHLALLAHPAP